MTFGKRLTSTNTLAKALNKDCTDFSSFNKQTTCKISIAEKGFVNPILFANGKIIFQKDYSVDHTKIIEFEILVANIKNWEDINFALQGVLDIILEI